MQLPNSVQQGNSVQEIFVSKNKENNGVSKELKVALEANLGIK
jgi:hypothetical protein